MLLLINLAAAEARIELGIIDAPLLIRRRCSNSEKCIVAGYAGNVSLHLSRCVAPTSNAEPARCSASILKVRLQKA